jgi:rhamnose transport system permease protein
MLPYKREMAVTAAYVILLAILAWRSPAFFQGDKFHSLLVSSAPVLVVAIGMTLVVLARHIDISVGSQFALCGVVAGLLAKAGLPMPLVGVATLLTGALLGAINGVLVGTWGLPSIVVTLATMVILREGLGWMRQGEAVQKLPSDFQWFGLSQAAGQALILVVVATVFLVFLWGLRYLAAGRAVFATGSDPEAAWLVGIRPRRTVAGVFVTMGALTGLAALLNAVRFITVDPHAGNGLEIQVIAAVVVGGVAITGGRGTLVGPLVGVALFGTIGSALEFLGAPAYWEKAIQGAIILVVIAWETLTLRRRKDAAPSLATA